MNVEKLQKKEGYSVTHSSYSFPWEGHSETWKEILEKLGKELDKLEVKPDKVSKIELEGDEILVTCLELYGRDKKGKIERLH